MSRCARLQALLLTIYTASAALAADQPAASFANADSAAGDVQDLILLSPTHPVRIRLYIEVNGVGFRDVWRKAADGAFDRFDTAKRGHLSADQAQRLIAMFVGGNAASPVIALPPAPAAMSKGAPREFSREEMLQRLAQAAPAFATQNRLSSGGAGPAIFSLLDTDGDGRLSRAELNAAPQSLRCRDFNDDGLLTPEELIQGPAQSSTAQPDQAAPAGPVLIVGPGTTLGELIDAILYRYDRNRDGRLSLAGSPVEIRSPKKLLADYDVDHDQSLDRAELATWLQSPPDVELNFQFGQKAGSKPMPRQQSDAAGTYRLRRKLDGGYRLTVAENDVDFRRNNRDPAQANQPPRLADYDRDADGRLNAEEQKAAGLADALPLVDADGDGQVSREEFDAYFAWRNSLASARLVLEITDEGQDLFSLLDHNGDGILSPRELKMAEEILAAADSNHDASLTSDEIPYRLVLELSRGGLATAPAAKAKYRMPQPRPAKSDRPAPDWLMKMDRNGDGELSPDEFLGSRDQFEKIDLNKDGLIDAAEAAAASKSN